MYKQIQNDTNVTNTMWKADKKALAIQAGSLYLLIDMANLNSKRNVVFCGLFDENELRLDITTNTIPY